MAGRPVYGRPVAAEYGGRFHRPEFLDLVAEQALLMREKTRDEKTGLWYHAWDCAKKQEWADPETGLSPEFWGRSIGWVPVAVLDDLDFLPEEHPGYEKAPCAGEGASGGGLPVSVSGRPLVPGGK